MNDCECPNHGDMQPDEEFGKSYVTRPCENRGDRKCLICSMNICDDCYFTVRMVIDLDGVGGENRELGGGWNLCGECKMRHTTFNSTPVLISGGTI